MMLLQTIAVAGLVAVVAGQTASTEFPETSPMWTRVFGQRNLARCECAELSVSVPCMKWVGDVTEMRCLSHTRTHHWRRRVLYQQDISRDTQGIPLGMTLCPCLICV